MRRNLALAFFLCLAATSGFAQSRLNGKWATAREATPLTITDAQRRQSVQMEVTIEDAQASGTLNFGGLGGRFYTFKDGKVTGNKVLFRTDAQPELTWTIELVDDNTVMLSRGQLPIVGNNVLNLISLLGATGQPTTPVQVSAAMGPPVAPSATVAQGGANTSISGIVHDPSKALIPGATVTAANVDTGVKLTTTTNEAGRYGFPSVIPGKYTMTASVPGLKTTTASNLTIGDTQFLQDFTLEFTAPASANFSPESCGQSSIGWCSLLHRAK